MLNESKFLELYNRQKESGLNVKDFCSNEGIAKSTFYYWLKKLQKARGKKNFIPLVVKSTQTVSTQHYSRNNQPVQGPGEIDDDILLEVVYPNRTKLRIKKDIDLTYLQALICLYD
jgi:transposase-like protein